MSQFFVERSWSHRWKDQQPSPVYPGQNPTGIGVHIQSTRVSNSLKVKSRCRPLFLVPYVCRSLSLFLLFLLLGLVASVLRHSFDTPYNRYFHPHPTPLATKATATSSPRAHAQPVTIHWFWDFFLQRHGLSSLPETRNHLVRWKKQVAANT